MCEGKRTNVGIINKLNEKIDLQVNCKSGDDDDLGLYVIPYGEKYEFTFKHNTMGTTLYFCGFQWQTKVYYFDMYEFKRDVDVCKNSCMWNIVETGPCRVQGQCFPWYNN